jgi:hypothetical protein
MTSLSYEVGRALLTDARFCAKRRPQTPQAHAVVLAILATSYQTHVANTQATYRRQPNAAGGFVGEPLGVFFNLHAHI